MTAGINVDFSKRGRAYSVGCIKRLNVFSICRWRLAGNVGEV